MRYLLSGVAVTLLVVSLFIFHSEAPSYAEGPGDTPVVPATAPQQTSPFKGQLPSRDRYPKLDSALAALADASHAVPSDTVVNSTSASQASNAAASLLLTGTLMVDRIGHVQVYIKVTRFDQDVQADLAWLHTTIERTDEAGTLLQARLPVRWVEELARLPYVVSVTAPSYGVVNIGSRMTEGDAILNFDDARSALGVDGSGVKVGVISDGIYGLSNSIALGDLPATNQNRVGGKLLSTSGGVIALSFRADGNLEGGLGELHGAEGTAILEIVHDIAPGAQLYFANFSTDLEFMDAVDWLASQCDVVIDDIGFLGVPYDQTSDVSLNTSAKLNTLDYPIRGYYTSAGNFAKSHYQGLYTDSGETLTPPSGNLHLSQEQPDTVDCHDLGPRAANFVYLPNGASVSILLTWDDTFGATTTDYDLYLFANSSGEYVDGSYVDNALLGEPVERIDYANTTGSGDYFDIVIENYENASVPKTFDMFVFGGSPLLCGTYLGYNTAASSISAQSDAGGGVVSVGAINASDPGADTIASYSSRGPTNNGVTKPDVTAIDGVSVTGSGGFSIPFYGTSAAAPHVAGLAALLLEIQPEWKAGGEGDDPAADRAALRSAILSSAVDLGAPGVDNTYGAGRVDGSIAAQQADPTPTPTPSPTPTATPTSSPTPTATPTPTPTPFPTPPPGMTAYFDATPAFGNTPLVIQFTDRSTGDITSWSWDFDDDGTVDSTEQNPTQTFTSSGLYTVVLTVSGPGGSATGIRTNYIRAGAVLVPTVTHWGLLAMAGGMLVLVGWRLGHRPRRA